MNSACNAWHAFTNKIQYMSGVSRAERESFGHFGNPSSRRCTRNDVTVAFVLPKRVILMVHLYRNDIADRVSVPIKLSVQMFEKRLFTRCKNKRTHYVIVDEPQYRAASPQTMEQTKRTGTVLVGDKVTDCGLPPPRPVLRCQTISVSTASLTTTRYLGTWANPRL